MLIIKKINYVVIISNLALVGNCLNSLYLSDLPLVKGNMKGPDFNWLLRDFKMNVLIMVVRKNTTSNMSSFFQSSEIFLWCQFGVETKVPPTAKHPDF